MKKTRLQNLLNKLSGTDDTELGAFKVFDEEVKKLQDTLHQAIKVSTLDEVNEKIGAFKKKMDLAPLLQAFDQLKTELAERDEEKDAEFQSELEQRLEALNKSMADSDGLTDERLFEIEGEIAGTQRQLSELANRKAPEMPDFTPQIKEAEARVMTALSQMEQGIKAGDATEELRGLITSLETALKKLRSDVMSRQGGGNQNRQILIGNVDPLTRYTDINLKPGNNVTITYANNDQTKKVDVTITGTGGSGTTRSINSISSDTTAGSTAGTDYVYLVSGTTTLTLPTAVGNANLYTVKNVGTGVVTVATTGAETIDNDSSVIMPVRYTSVDLISDTANWSIT